VTSDAIIAADEQTRTAARLRGAAEALSVLRRRAPAERQRACRFAMSLLAAHVPATDWVSAGLPSPPWPARRAEHPLPAGHQAVLQLARSAMTLYRSELRGADRPAAWQRLAAFFARQLPSSEPELVLLREHVMLARLAAADTGPEVLGELSGALGFHRAVHGEDAYLTALARANVLVALLQRGAELDLAEAAALAQEEIAFRTIRYGPDHPATLAARSLLGRCLLMQAEAAQDETGQLRLAGRALAEITPIRVARDRLFGVTSPEATSSRRYEARALLLLGEGEKARNCLLCTLAFEYACHSGAETPSVGQTLYQLARVERALGNTERAFGLAEDAHRIFSRHYPGGSTARQARELIRELGAAITANRLHLARPRGRQA
jgi:tetratricopeptide (TPR) repeat protein